MEDLLSQLEKSSETPRSIVSLRRKYLEGNGAGLASVFAPQLAHGIGEFLGHLQVLSGDDSSLASHSTSLLLGRILKLHLHLSRNDPALAEELGRCCPHSQLLKLMGYDISDHTEEQQDCIIDMQDMACEIGSFSKRLFPFTVEELQARLPLVFEIAPAPSDMHNKEQKCATEEILINQVTVRQSAQKDVGFVMWPSSVVLSRWLMTNPSSVCGKRVIELGAGCGLCGLTAARIQERQSSGEHKRQSVVLTDFNLVVVENLQRNTVLNDLANRCVASPLDFYQQTGKERDSWKDMNDQVQEAADVVLAADMICQPSDAFAAANAVFDALVPGGKAFCVCADSAHRFGVDRFSSDCERVGLVVKSKSVKDLYNGEFLETGLDKTTGYVEGMTLTFFELHKPNQ